MVTGFKNGRDDIEVDQWFGEQTKLDESINHIGDLLSTSAIAILIIIDNKSAFNINILYYEKCDHKKCQIMYQEKKTLFSLQGLGYRFLFY